MPLRRRNGYTPAQTHAARRCTGLEATSVDSLPDAGAADPGGCQDRGPEAPAVPWRTSGRGEHASPDASTEVVAPTSGAATALVLYSLYVRTRAPRDGDRVSPRRSLASKPGR